MSPHGRTSDEREFEGARDHPHQSWRPWWVVGSPGQIVWFGFLGCIWAYIAIDNLVTRHRPQDYWYAGTVTLWWAVLIVNIVAWFTRRDVILRPEVPMTAAGKAVRITGALLASAGALVPGFLIAHRPAIAVVVLVVGVASGAALAAWSRRLVNPTQR